MFEGGRRQAWRYRTSRSRSRLVRFNALLAATTRRGRAGRQEELKLPAYNSGLGSRVPC
jgi:hypothetical protein